MLNTQSQFLALFPPYFNKTVDMGLRFQISRGTPPKRPRRLWKQITRRMRLHRSGVRSSAKGKDAVTLAKKWPKSEKHALIHRMSTTFTRTPTFIRWRHPYGPGAVIPLSGVCFKSVNHLRYSTRSAVTTSIRSSPEISLKQREGSSSICEKSGRTKRGMMKEVLSSREVFRRNRKTSKRHKHSS